MLHCSEQHSCACDQRYSSAIKIRVQVNGIVRWLTLQWKWDTVRWSTLQCMWPKIQCGGQHYSVYDEGYSAVVITTLQVDGTVRWSTLKGKRTVQCDDQNYSASECYSAVINTTVKEDFKMQWSKLQCVWWAFSNFPNVLHLSVGWGAIESNWKPHCCSSLT
jgi:hypothetical protein